MSIPKYDVFLSFRGEDTCDNFTSHLNAELCRQNIETVIYYRLDRGEEISPALYKAIEESKIYVIILSEHYASSSWCLDELTEILKCKDRYGRELIPVFYKVDPSNVRHQRHSYADDLVKHHQRFGHKVDAWKAALTQVAGISGWVSQNISSPESTLVTAIRKDIGKKLNRCLSSDYEGMTGIDNHIENIQSLLLLECPTVRIIGIWGMGGIGKTTIANAIFEKLASHFSSRSIVLNVQQEIERDGLSQLLNEIITSSESNSYGQRLKRTKALLVFDDVKDSDQLKDLIGTHSNFGKGSRIIVTSRDRQVLENANADEIYQVREMDYHDSLQLFCLFAFKQNHPKESFVSLTEKVLDYAQGLPLALKVLGSLLYGRTKKVWESELRKLEKLPDLKIFRLLKLSYDGLDEEQKDIFLDIACFYRGEFEKHVAVTLDSCGFSARIGMDVLKDKCLISISEYGTVWMHDLIQEMGHEIVRRQDKDGKRSRLWKTSDIYDVLSKNKGKGTEAIQCIFLDMKEMWERKDVQLHDETFKKMHKLRMIKFYNGGDSNVTFRAFLKCFPNDLKFLQWDCFPQRSLPRDFFPGNLVILDMRYSKLEQLWEGDQALPNLKSLNLSYSLKLVGVPDLSFFPNIEEIILRCCVSLVQVYSSSFLNKLNWLYLGGCTKLESLKIQSNILSRSSGLVVLHDCYKLEMLLISDETDVYISSDHCVYSNLKGNRLFNPQMKIELNDKGDYEILKYNSSTVVTRFNELCWLDISNCKSLTCIPAELFNFKVLRRLSLGGCLKLEVLPEIKETMENLKVLILDKTAIKELPSSLLHLVGLQELSLQSCTKLKTIPSSIGNLSKLLKLNLAYCASLETFPNSIFKLKLTELNFEGCSMLRTFPEILEPTENFAHINLTETAIQHLPLSLEYFVGLQTLNLKLCINLVSLPNSIVKLNLLSQLDCFGCWRLTEIPNNIGRLSSLTELSLQGSSIVNLPDSMAHLSSLKSLNISDCTLLECVPKLPPNLNQVSAFDCPSIKRMMLNSRSDSAEGAFNFYLTNSQKVDATSLRNIEKEAYIKINNDAYSPVLFCFPGNAVPDWFPHRCQGHSITIRSDELYFCGEDRLNGVALCVVLGGDFPYKFKHYSLGYSGNGFTYKLRIETVGEELIDHHKLAVKYKWSGQNRSFAQDHTFLWNIDLSGHEQLIDARTITFEIVDKHYNPLSLPSTMAVKECGIFPLYKRR